ncbi:Triosephosphate isomerase-like protein [Chaetomium sp. MPI-SDFR-AT-0129]|nr:Triosephosphate isomerase-like protein [Chaetomium sp. MPI-SDFR-AT-0129]
MSSPGPPIRPVSGNRPLIGVSTKMYFTHARTSSYLSSVLSLLTPSSSFPSSSAIQTALAQTDTFFIPSFLSLPSAIATVASAPAPANRLLIGAQNCAPTGDDDTTTSSSSAGGEGGESQDLGPYTGEISAYSLAEVGCAIVEIGHAERRRLFGETDEDVRRKAVAVVRNGMVPLVCVGEVDRPPAAEDHTGTSTGEDEKGEEGGAAAAAAAAVLRQVNAVLSHLPPNADVILAYEPVWAIGAPAPASAEHVMGVVRLVRGSEVVQGRSGRTRMVYGGAAGPGLWGKLEGEVDGLFLGRFAHRPEQFVKMVCEVAGVEWVGE